MFKKYLPKIKDGTYLMILDEYKSIVTHSIVLYVNDDNISYFENVGIEYILKEIQRTWKYLENIFRIQVNDSIMCGNCCVGFVDFMQKV